MKMTLYSNTILKRGTMMEKFTFMMTAHNQGVQLPVGTVQGVFLEQHQKLLKLQKVRHLVFHSAVQAESRLPESGSSEARRKHVTVVAHW